MSVILSPVWAGIGQMLPEHMLPGQMSRGQLESILDVLRNLNNMALLRSTFA